MGRGGVVRIGELRSVGPNDGWANDGWVPSTKLTPPVVPDEVVIGAGLLGRTTELIRSNRLTLLIAPGGSGKTTLAATATATLDAPVAWLRLHPSDDAPGLFTELTAAAVEQAATGSCAFTLELLRSGQARSLSTTRLLGALINDLHRLGSVVLVLEDLHQLESEPTLEALAYLLEFAPPELRVVATTRRPPALPLARLRSAAGVGELTADDLRLDTTTAAAVLQRRGIEPDPERVDELLSMSNGWVTGFLLGASTPTNGVAPRAEASESAAALTDYLAEEVVGAEPPRNQWFLRAAAILDELDPDRCATVTGVAEAAEILADVQHRLGFFLVHQAGHLRFHDLLADHLRAELLQNTSAADRAGLHRRAAATAVTEAERIDHLLAADEQEAAGATIEELARSSERHPALDDQLLTWIGRLDPKVREQRPWLDLVAGTAAANDLDREQAVGLLRSVLDRAAGENDYQLRWLAVAALGRATHDLERWMPELGRMESDDRFGSLPVSARVDWLIAGSWGGLWSRNLELARARAEAAMELQHTSDDHAAAETLALHLGFPLAAWPGAVEVLVAHHRRTLDAFGDRSWVIRLGARLQLAALGMLRGDLDDATPLPPAEANVVDDIPFFAIARDFVRAARAGIAADHHTLHAVAAPLAEAPASGFGAMLAPLLAASYRQQGSVEDLRTLQQGLRRWTGGPPGGPAMAVVSGLVDAELAWAEGRTDEAALGLAELLADHAPLLVAPLCDPGCELALLQAERGRIDTARRTLGERLDHLGGRLGSPGRVAQAGPGLVPLLEQLADAGHPGAPRVLEILGRPPAPPARQVPATGETLTSREVQVLGLIADGASNAEVAEALHVSMNTVKTHAKRVMAKLGASSRAEAAAIARRQHLL